MTTSTHKVEVIPIKLEKHPNADKLSIIPVFGYTCCGQTAEWKDRKLGAWVPPDALAPITRSEFAFLKDIPGAKFYDEDSTRDSADLNYYRVTVKKFRGVISYGLLVPAPEGSKEGDDVAELLGVKHYDPPLKASGCGPSGLVMGGEVAKSPSNVYAPKYDVDSFQRYAKLIFKENEPCVVTEKIHGASGRWVFKDGAFHCGSRTEWKKEFPTYDHVTVEGLIDGLNKRAIEKGTNVPTGVGRDDEWTAWQDELRVHAESIIRKLQSKQRMQNMWWQALDKYPAMKDWLEAHEGLVVYGEVFGAVQDLRYGHGSGEVSIGVFDIMRGNEWVGHVEARELGGDKLPWIPIVHPLLPFDFDAMVALAEGESLVPGADHFREGVVVKPIIERNCAEVGRVQLKIVSQQYLSKGA